MDALIELKKVSFSAQDEHIVKDCSYAFKEGKVTALVGPAGCGKSTLLKLCAGLLVPSEGEVCFRGRDILSMTRKENLDFRQTAAVVFQDSALWANQSIYEILNLPLSLHFPHSSKEDRDRRIREVLDEVGYKKELHIRPALLSMGEQKLIAFARALTCRPSILFLDEWTESVDTEAALRLIQIVERHKEQNNTVIFVNHDFRIIRNLADYLVMVAAGKIHMVLSREELEADGSLAQRIEKGIAS